METPASTPLNSLSQRFTLIVGALRARVWVRSGQDRGVERLVGLVWKRLARLASRFEALVERLEAGRPVLPRPPCSLVARVRTARIVDPSKEVLRLPTERGWLVQMVRTTAELRGQIEALLADPEMLALLKAAPDAGRVFRPLCHMLMIDPGPALALPGSVKPAPRPRAVKPAPAPPPLDEASAISLIWATLRSQGLVVTPEPVRRKPPWPGLDFSR